MRAFLTSVWHVWKRVGQAIADFVSRALLTLFYFTLFAPVGLGVRLLGDPLAIKNRGVDLWLERGEEVELLEAARRLS